ncbi:hypothetical protein EAX61_14305 [Dokdonia sinensis]|uniref:DUF2975 domain-containing protein n=1 Tax=Dokdonia sinensis TaxID=2479847 RepID=A0A3M0FWQ7_9FLAO|nr:hypothetical protein [Dokdonia sinensis]RMB56407.1 hypothetical protein EAX61_14305 [Dokdonia sinensis]
MKNISTLSTIIKYFYYGLNLFFYLACAGAIALFFSGKTIETDGCDGLDSVNFGAWGTILYTACCLGLFYVFILAINHLKQTTPFLHKGVGFSEPVSNGFKNGGRFLVYTGIGTALLQFVGPLVLLSKLQISFDSVFLTAVFLVIVGLYFMFFGEAFLQAKALKEENELTV